MGLKGVRHTGFPGGKRNKSQREAENVTSGQLSVAGHTAAQDDCGLAERAATARPKRHNDRFCLCPPWEKSFPPTTGPINTWTEFSWTT